mgnify:CR=1 FL=1
MRRAPVEAGRSRARAPRPLQACPRTTTDAPRNPTGNATRPLDAPPLPAQPFRLGVSTFPTGPIPVVLVPLVQLYLSDSGQVEAAITTSAVASLTANAGVNYDGRSPNDGLDHRLFANDTSHLAGRLIQDVLRTGQEYIFKKSRRRESTPVARNGTCRSPPVIFGLNESPADYCH